MNEEALGRDGRRRTVRHAIETSILAIPLLRAARAAGESDVAAFRRYAERVREGLVRSAESRAREAR